MKKIFTFLSILLVSLVVFTACDNDDTKLTYPVDSNGNPVIPTDNDPIVEPTPDQLVLHISSYTISLGETVEFTSFLNGANVTDLSTYRVNNNPIQGRYFKPNAVGTYQVIATLQGATNSVVKELIVNEVQEPVDPILDIEPGEGNVTLNSTPYPANYHFLDLVGVYYTDETETAVEAIWESYTIDNNNLNLVDVAAIFRFSTPAQLTENGQASYSFPNATNATLLKIVYANAGNNQFQDITAAVGTIKYNEIIEDPVSVKFAANTTFPTSNTLTVTFTGSAGLDLTPNPQQRPNGSNNIKAKKKAKVNSKASLPSVGSRIKLIKK